MNSQLHNYTIIVKPKKCNINTVLLFSPQSNHVQFFSVVTIRFFTAIFFLSDVLMIQEHLPLS